MDVVAVRLVIPLAELIWNLHPQVIRPPPRVSEQRQVYDATHHAWRIKESHLYKKMALILSP